MRLSIQIIIMLAAVIIGFFAYVRFDRALTELGYRRAYESTYNQEARR